MQIAVALAHEAFVAARGEDALPVRKLALGPRREPLQRGGAVLIRAERPDLLEVLPRLGNHVRGRAELAARPGACDLRVERGDLGREVVHERRRQLPARCDAIEESVLRELVHLHRVVDRASLAPEPGLGFGAGHRHDLEIEIGRRPAVQAELLLACPLARFERAEVEEPERNWLFQLVRVLPGQEHPGDVRLEERDCRDRMGIAERIAERCDRRRGHRGASAAAT